MTVSRVYKINKNDSVNGKGISVSVWFSGCPHKCKGCFNQETWDPYLGNELTDETIDEIIEAIGANGITRNLSILGGEPLAPYNINSVGELLVRVRDVYPDIMVYLWTGYEWEDLREGQLDVVEMVNVLVDGPFDIDKKDITLELRGSSNQRILNREERRWLKKHSKSNR
jgi:anaerobic ribonucleoside-triphosphate reductase activating protein